MLNLKDRNNRKRQKRLEEEEEAEHDMARNVSFIQANLQHSIAAARVLTRSVRVKGIDMTLVEVPYRGIARTY